MMTTVEPTKLITRDGVKLAFSDLGSGPEPIILLHGWACDRTFLQPQFEHLSRLHRVLALDLRGHGESTAPERQYTVAEFAEDVHELSQALHLPPSVVVGHSMGGQVALELSAAYPEDVSAICLIDSVVFPPDSLLAELRRVFSALTGPDYLEALTSAAESLFMKTDDPARKSVLVEKMRRTSQHVAAASFRSHLLDYDPAAAVASCKAPIAYLGAIRTLADIGKFRSYYPQLITGQTVGSGHFSPLEVPEQINSMLDRYLAIAVKSRPE